MIIAMGAEAILKREGDLVIKERIEKKYRVRELDEKLRRFRTRREAKILEKCKKFSAKLIEVDEDNKRIMMEYVDGELLRDVLDGFDESKRRDVMKRVGEIVAKMHEMDVMHGDITTSNIFLRNEDIVIIDFGLGFFSKKIEDRAVDLHLFRQALNSKHYLIAEKCFDEFLDGYRDYFDFDNVMKRLEKVERRGRYKRKE